MDRYKEDEGGDVERMQTQHQTSMRVGLPKIFDAAVGRLVSAQFELLSCLLQTSAGIGSSKHPWRYNAMAEHGTQAINRLDSVVLLARDYGASSHNDHMHWFISNMLESKILASVRNDSVGGHKIKFWCAAFVSAFLRYFAFNCIWNPVKHVKSLKYSNRSLLWHWICYLLPKQWI